MWDVKFCVGDLIIRKNGLTLGVVHAVEAHNNYGVNVHVFDSITCRTMPFGAEKHHWLVGVFKVLAR